MVGVVGSGSVRALRGSAGNAADFNADGMTDFFVFGRNGSYDQLQYFEQQSSDGVFVNIVRDANYFVNGFARANNRGDIHFVDYNGDKMLDFSISGCTDDFISCTGVMQIYIQVGYAVFSDKTSVYTPNADAFLPQVSIGKHDWVDYNRDGRPDLLVSGKQTQTSLAFLINSCFPQYAFDPIIGGCVFCQGIVIASNNSCIPCPPHTFFLASANNS